MIFLHSHGVGTSRAVRIFKTYGADAIRLISEIPYRLARDIRVHRLQERGYHRREARHREDGDDPGAGRDGYALPEAKDEGHCGLLEVPAEILEAALDLELRDGGSSSSSAEWKTSGNP